MATVYNAGSVALTVGGVPIATFSERTYFDQLPMPSVRKPYITVLRLGSGWAAAHMVFVNDGHGSYWDVEQTGMGRYASRMAAAEEAREWAAAEGLPTRNLIDPSSHHRLHQLRLDRFRPLTEGATHVR